MKRPLIVIAMAGSIESGGLRLPGSTAGVSPALVEREALPGPRGTTAALRSRVSS